jgi:hypothetical protein
MNNVIHIVEANEDYAKWWVNFVYDKLEDLNWATAEKFVFENYNAVIDRDKDCNNAKLVFANEEDALAFRIKYVYG